MKILDWYIMREYIRSFLLSFAFFVALVIVVRMFDREISQLLAGDVTVIDAIKIVLYKSPARIVEVTPAAASLAAFFVFSRFAQNNELAAMKSAGVSMYRIIFLIASVTFVICIFAGIFNDRVASVASWRSHLLEKRIPYYINRNTIFKGKGNRMYYVQNLSLKDKKFINLTIYEFNERNELKSEISASSATWFGNTWMLKNGIVRSFANGREIESSKFDIKKFNVNEDVTMFAESGRTPKEMTHSSLSKLVKYKKEAGRVFREELVEMHHRISYSFASLVVVIITAPLAIQFGRGGIAAGFLITMFLSFMYWGIAIAIFEALGANGKLPPAVASWMANVLFAMIGGILIWKVKK